MVQPPVTFHFPLTDRGAERVGVRLWRSVFVAALRSCNPDLVVAPARRRPLRSVARAQRTLSSSSSVAATKSPPTGATHAFPRRPRVKRQSARLDPTGRSLHCARMLRHTWSSSSSLRSLSSPEVDVGLIPRLSTSIDATGRSFASLLHYSNCCHSNQTESSDASTSLEERIGGGGARSLLSSGAGGVRQTRSRQSAD